MMRFTAILLATAVSLFAREDEREPLPTISTQTTHEIMLESGPLVYVATVDSIPVRNEADGEELGRIYFTSYQKEGVEESDARPITFAFDGGPGGSSAGVHLMGLGPKRILTFDEGQTPVAPYAWVDNPDTLLAMTDLVFIDPVGTGFSRAAEPEIEGEFHSVPGDLISIGDFICDLLTKSGRWKSPKYIFGCSYGTFRACGLAAYLLNHGIFLNGLILDSCAIDYQTIDFLPDNELPYSLIIPSFTATAWFHGRLDPKLSLEEAVAGARSFAFDAFAPALLKEGVVPPELYVNIAYWTGLPIDFIERNRGLIDDMTYCVNFLNSPTEVIGHNDSRLTGQILPPRQARVNYIDPGVRSLGLISAVTKAYFHDELACDVDWPRYELFSGNALYQWRWFGGMTPNAMGWLRFALAVNPSLRLYVSCGYYDLNTPFAAAEHSLKRLRLPVEKNVSLHYYEAGHGSIFSNPQTLKQFRKDMAKFYQ
jgi:carboxypeptidase C (cathepsin A)